LEAKKKEAIAEYAKNNPDKSAELTKLQADLKAAQDALAAAGEGGGDDAQKKRLKADAQTAEAKLNEVTAKFTKELTDLKASIYGGRKTKVLDALAGKDVELRKKIELEYDGFKGEPANEVEIEARLIKAATIVSGTKPAPNFMDGMSSGGTKGNGSGQGSVIQETENGKAMRAALGISDADAQKYAPKA
jgi:hypothetical protein